MAYKKKTKKIKRTISLAVAHIKSTFNNTLVSITDTDGNVVLSSSAGKLGFKGAKKGTPYSATQVGSTIARDMIALGIKEVEVKMQGAGNGRDSLVRALQTSGLHVTALSDVTPLPHNGPRPPKKRRV